jgi:GntR family transcriptional regulator
LDLKSRLPLYIQLANLIRIKVQEGTWRPGEQIPTESELCDLHQVSRITVRQAIAELVQEGYLERYPGRGTFVAEPRIEQRLSRLTGFTQDMQARGKVPGARVLQFTVVEPPTALPWAYHLEDEEKVILLKRLRLADGEPLAVEMSYLSFNLCAAILDGDLEDCSLYARLEEACNIIPSRAGQQWTAGLSKGGGKAPEYPRVPQFCIFTAPPTTNMTSLSNGLSLSIGETNISFRPRCIMKRKEGGNCDR